MEAIISMSLCFRCTLILFLCLGKKRRIFKINHSNWSREGTIPLRKTLLEGRTASGNESLG